MIGLRLQITLKLNYEQAVLNRIYILEKKTSLEYVKVKIWRRSFDVPPPPMEPGHAFYEAIRNDPRYKDGPTDEEFPTCESLKLTIGK